MLKSIILNDIKQNIQSLKLQLTFVIMLVIFIVGSVTYVIQYKDAIKDHLDYSSKLLENRRKDAENITRTAVEETINCLHR